MEFGIWSNGFRPHTSAAATFEEDITEIVLADQLGFRDAYISEHHGELPHIGRVDTIPVPELMMCKAAALTKQIRMGAAVKLIHLQHPLDVAEQATTTEHLIGEGRFIFGFGTGFGNPLFCEERGLTFDDRHIRSQEALDFILRCWQSEQPFDFDGKYWQGCNIIALPKPMNGKSIPIATATVSEPTVALAGERGFTLLSAHFDSAAAIRARSALYQKHARAAGHADPISKITVSRIIHIAESKAAAIEDMREAVQFETSVQAERGFLKMMKQVYGLDLPTDRTAVDCLVDAGIYVVGSPDEVAAQLEQFVEDCGGIGTLLMVTGKAWGSRETRLRSMRLFMEEVAPKLRTQQVLQAAE
jgi:limonene 1,2-monooxygenase